MEILIWSVAGAIIFFVTCFSCWAIGFWQGEQQAARNYRTMQRVNNGTAPLPEHLF